LAVFKPGTEITTDTTQPTIDVTIDPAAPLAPGNHVFQLVVVDDRGNRSQPATVTVVVKDNLRPTAVLVAPPTVDFGKSFTLDGRGSSELPPGKLKSFEWTMIS
jgi:hypothetical protein